MFQLIKTTISFSNPTYLYIVIVGHQMFGQILHIGTKFGMLSDPQRVSRVTGQQVLHPLVVYLEVADLRAVGRSRLLAGGDTREQLATYPRYQALGFLLNVLPCRKALQSVA